MLSSSFRRSLSSISRHSTSFTSFQHASLSTLVVGEYASTSSGSVSLSDSTYSGIVGAKQLGPDNKISLLLASDNTTTNSTLISQAKHIDGLSSILSYTGPSLSNSLPEFVTDVIIDAHSKNSYSHIIAGISSFTRDVIPRVAGVLDISQISDITSIISPTTFERPLYAGNAICKIESKRNDGVNLITLRLTSFQFDKSNGLLDNENDNIEVSEEVFESNESYNGKKHIADELASNEGPSLQSASIVVSGGRGMQNGDNFSMLYDMSKKFGDCAVGASRAAVDAGFVSNDLQVGQTGKVVAPNLYIAVGISGAIQHIAGMKDSKIIVAINKDEEAPIFAIADYGLKADLFEAVPELSKKMDG